MKKNLVICGAIFLIISALLVGSIFVSRHFSVNAQNQNVKHEHVFCDWETKKEPTCENDGVETRKCDCGESESKIISALGHKFGDWKITKNPTCLENGEETRVCIHCDKSESKIISALGHDYVNDICQNCGDKKEISAHFLISQKGELSLSNDDLQNFPVRIILTGEDETYQFVFDNVLNLTKEISVKSGIYEYTILSEKLIFSSVSGEIEVNSQNIEIKFDFFVETTSCLKFHLSVTETNNNNSIVLSGSLDTVNILIGELNDNHYIVKLKIFDINGVLVETFEHTHQGGSCGDSWTTNLLNDGEKYTLQMLYMSKTNTKSYVSDFVDFVYEHGKLYEFTYEASIEHEFGGWQITKNSTCLEKGTKIQTCSACGFEILEEIPALDHDYRGFEYYDLGSHKVDICLNCGEWAHIDAGLAAHLYDENGVCVDCHFNITRHVQGAYYIDYPSDQANADKYSKQIILLTENGALLGLGNVVNNKAILQYIPNDIKDLGFDENNFMKFKVSQDNSKAEVFFEIQELGIILTFNYSTGEMSVDNAILSKTSEYEVKIEDIFTFIDKNGAKYVAIDDKYNLPSDILSIAGYSLDSFPVGLEELNILNWINGYPVISLRGYPYPHNDASSLKKIFIPSNVRRYDCYFFDYCDNLDEIVFDGIKEFLPYSCPYLTCLSSNSDNEFIYKFINLSEVPVLDSRLSLRVLTSVGNAGQIVFGIEAPMVAEFREAYPEVHVVVI